MRADRREALAWVFDAIRRAPEPPADLPDNPTNTAQQAVVDRECLAPWVGFHTRQAPYVETWLHWLGRAEVQHDHVIALGEMLDQHGARGILLKGEALRQSIYADFPGARQMSDVDVWLTPDARELAREWLRDRGFAGVPGNPYTLALPTAAGAMVFDLHDDRALVGARRRGVFEPPLPTWRECAVPTAVAGLARLRDDHQFVHLLVHAARHAFDRLMWLLDLRLALINQPPETIAAACEEARAIRPLMWMLHGLADEATSAAFAELVPQSTRMERSLLEQIWTHRRCRGRGYLLALAAAGGLGGRLTFLARSVPLAARSVAWRLGWRR